jgi:hypothetical protein
MTSDTVSLSQTQSYTSETPYKTYEMRNSDPMNVQMFQSKTGQKRSRSVLRPYPKTAKVLQKETLPQSL